MRKVGGVSNSGSTATAGGVANYLSAVGLGPDGASAWMASTRHDSERGLLLGPHPDHDNTGRAVVWQIDRGSGAVLESTDTTTATRLLAARRFPYS